MLTASRFNLLACLQNVWGHLGKRRKYQLWALLLLMVLVSLFDVLSIGAIVPFLGALVSPNNLSSNPLIQKVGWIFSVNTPPQLTRILALGFSAIIILSAFLHVLLIFLQTRISQGIGLDLGTSIYNRTLHQPYAVHMRRNSSDVIAGIWKSDTLVGSFVFPILTIISTLLMMMLTIPMLLFISGPLLFLLCGVLLAVYGLLTVVSRNKVIEYSAAISRSQNRVLQVMQEGLGGVRDVLLDNSQDVFVTAYKSADSERRNATGAIQILSTTPKFILESVATLLLVLLAFFWSNQADGVSQSIPLLGAIALGVQRMLPAAQQAYSSWTTIRGGYASLKDVLDLLNQPMPLPTESLPNNVIAFSQAITLKKLSFQYSKGMPWILKDVNLLIRKGARIGIVGATGCGKSTLVDLIMGLLFPSEGEILIDDKPLSTTNMASWMSAVAHVPQMVFLADASIAENIAFGIPRELIDYERVRDAARKAQISKDIESWDLMYETKVGERGVRLSGGQRQRLGIARALYKKASVLILDEATSALDSETESMVEKTLDDLGGELTIISVAHRLSTLKKSDFIIQLDGGKIVRQMTYDQMMEKVR